MYALGRPRNCLGVLVNVDYSVPIQGSKVKASLTTFQMKCTISSYEIHVRKSHFLTH